MLFVFTATTAILKFSNNWRIIFSKFRSPKNNFHVALRRLRRMCQLFFSQGLQNKWYASLILACTMCARFLGNWFSSVQVREHPNFTFDKSNFLILNLRRPFWVTGMPVFFFWRLYFSVVQGSSSMKWNDSFAQRVERTVERSLTLPFRPFLTHTQKRPFLPYGGAARKGRSLAATAYRTQGTRPINPPVRGARKRLFSGERGNRARSYPSDSFRDALRDPSGVSKEYVKCSSTAKCTAWETWPEIPRSRWDSQSLCHFRTRARLSGA